MCEPTSVLKELERLKLQILGLDTNQKLGFLTQNGILSRLDLCINQLKAAGEGDSWYDLTIAPDGRMTIAKHRTTDYENTCG